MPWQERAFEHVSCNKGEQLFMAATTLVTRLCACVRYWPGRGLVYGTRVKLALTFVSVRVKPEQKTYFPLELAHLVGKVLDWSVVHFLQVVTVGDNINKANELKSKVVDPQFLAQIVLKDALKKICNSAIY